MNCYRLITLLFASTLLATSLLATPFSHDKHPYHLDLPEDWTVTRNSNRFLVLRHNDLPATLSVSVKIYPEFTSIDGVEEASITVNGLQYRRVTAYYDGWEKLFDREGTEEERVLAGVSDNRVAVFGKTILNENLSTSKKIAGEYYFLKRNHSYTITLLTHREHWQSVQDDLKATVASFWVGQGERPQFVPEKKEKTGWHMIGGSAAHNFFVDSFLDLKKPLNKEWSVHTNPVPTDNEFNTDPYFSLVASDDSLYFSVSNQLYAYTKAGNPKWSYPINSPLFHHLAYGDDMLFFVTEDDQNHLYSVIPQNGHVIYKRKLPSGVISHPIFYDHHLYIVTEDHLLKLSGASGKKAWKFQEALNLEHHPVIWDEHVLVVTQENGLEKVSPDTGKSVWSLPLDFPLLSTPIVAEDSLVLFYDNPLPEDVVTEARQIAIVSAEEGTITKYLPTPPYAQLVEKPVASQNQLFVLYLTGKYDETATYVLSSYSLPDGKVLWQHPFSLAADASPTQLLVTTDAILLNQGLPQNQDIQAIDRFNGTVILGEKTAISEQGKSKINRIYGHEDAVIIVEEAKQHYQLRYVK